MRHETRGKRARTGATATPRHFPDEGGSHSNRCSANGWLQPGLGEPMAATHIQGKRGAAEQTAPRKGTPSHGLARAPAGRAARSGRQGPRVGERPLDLPARESADRAAFWRGLPRRSRTQNTRLQVGKDIQQTRQTHSPAFSESLITAARKDLHHVPRS